jgi:hypothetical protein
MLFKKKKKGGLESLRSLVSTKLKETDAVETENGTSIEDDARDDAPAVIVSPSPRENVEIFQSDSDDSLSVRTIDRYDINLTHNDSAQEAYDQPGASAKEARDLPSLDTSVGINVGDMRMDRREDINHGCNGLRVDDFKWKDQGLSWIERNYLCSSSDREALNEVENPELEREGSSSFF